ncbi:NEW3 domain-containing protein [Lysobacter rhizosphaerae]
MPASQLAHADTFYVRVDGGDAIQCTGRSDAPYPGSGTGQACAWKHPFHALAPDGTRRITGGDTLFIGSGNYLMGQGASGAGNCLPANCSMASIPSGTGANRTRILGNASNPPRLLGTLGVTRILSLDGSSNVEVGYLEITDQDDCVYSHTNAAAKCPAVGSGNWGKYGVYARASSNVWLHDLDIHGLGHTGLWAGGLTDWTIERVKLNRNGRAGWDANTPAPASNSGAITLRDMEIGWNGCGERWQTGVAWACWAQQAGGYGDGFGTVTTGGQWLIEDVFVHHNTSDGLDLRFLDGADSTRATLRRIYAVGNAGNQVKVKGNATIENSVLIGNCGYFKDQFFMQTGDNCRSDGTTLMLVFTANDSVTVRHNTITGEGYSLVGVAEGDASAHALIQNNALIGFPYFLKPADLSRVQGGSSPAITTHAGNLVWNVYAGACPGDSICGQDPKLTRMTLATFDAEPLAGSPLVDKVTPLADLTTDFVLNPRPRGVASDIGAYEMQVVSTCVRSTPAIDLSGGSTAVPAGDAVTYTLTLTNTDSAACTATSFSLGDSVPSGWTGSLGSTSLNLAPGASGSTTLTITSAANATAGDYVIGAGASSGVGTVHTASATATYTVATPTPVCTRAAPTIDLSGPTSSVTAGSAVTYTLAVTNNDSAACPATSFSLARSVPSGWTGTLGDASFTLGPGTNASTTLSVTSDVDATPGNYTIGAGVSSSVGAVHTASSSASYTVATPTPVCTRAAPTIDLSGPAPSVPAGSTVTYTLAVTNNDSAACATTSFSLARSVPSGWTGTLDNAGLNLSPGASGSTTLDVTSDVGAAPGGYTIGAGVSSSVGAVHTASSSASYSVSAPTPVCTRAAPTIELSGSTSSVPAGSAITYTLSLTNNDSEACTTTSFSLARSVPSGWTGTLTATTLSLAPGASATTNLDVTSDADAAPGGYTIGAGVSSNVGAVHTANASAIFTVTAPPPVCTRAAPIISLSGPTAAVPAGSAVTYTLDVSNNDSSACAATTFNLAGSVPSGWSDTLGNASLNLAPGASGSTALSVTSATSAAAGGYTIGASASSSVGAAHDASTTVTYTVSTPPPVCTRAAPTIGLSGPTAAVPAGSAVTYTLDVSNNDSSACAATTFNLADSVPSGWSDTLGNASLNLAPGTSGSTTLSVTSATSAAAGGYTIGASASSSVGAVHDASTTVTYTVSTPPPVCTRAAPTIGLSGPTAAVPAGSAVTYTLDVSNNDSSACAATTFNLAGSVPSGWSDTLGNASLNLAPGASSSTTLSVTSATSATAGGYTIGASASSSVGAAHDASTTVTYTVSNPPPVCTRAAPSIGLSGPTAAVPAGSLVTYTLALTNNDSSACTTTSFNLARTIPSGWTGTLGTASLNLAPGASSSTTLSVTSATSATAGGYTIGASTSSSIGAAHDASTTVTYTVSTPPPVCTRAAPTIGLSGSTAAVPAGSLVTYTLALTNNDSSACATTSFNLARTVPSGWTGTLGTTSLSLAPGASSSTTLSVTSATNATAGGYTIGANVSSSVGAAHNASTTVTYTVSNPPPVCTRAAPTIGLSGSTAAVPAGTLVTYTLALTNNDSSACTTTSFNLARTIPSGWTGTLGTASLNLAPGASGNTTLSVTSATSATAGGYTVGASASSSVGAAHNASTTVTYTVSTPPPACTRAAPTIGLSGSTAAVPAGSLVTYTLALTNNDSSACTTTSFNLARAIPSGWTGTLGNASLSLAPGASGSTTLNVTSATSATAGGYTIGTSASSSVGAAHNASTSTTYTVAAATFSLQTDTSTDKATYLRGELVRINALVRNNGIPVSGATVTFAIIRPIGGNVVQTAVSGSDGFARTTYRLNKSKTAAGQYRAQASWSLGGATSSGTATFVVQ